jgi:hypothetical protein
MIRYPKSDFLVWVAELQAGKWDRTLKPVKNSLAKKPVTDENSCESDCTHAAGK